MGKDLAELATILLKNNKELNKYIAELQDDVKLDMYNLREKSLLCSSIWSKWLAYLYKEKENLARIAEMKSQLIKANSEKNTVLDSILRMKSEDKFAEKNETIKKLNKLSKITLDNIDFIERALNILLNFGFSIKNVTDVLKLDLNH